MPHHRIVFRIMRVIFLIPMMTVSLDVYGKTNRKWIKNERYTWSICATFDSESPPIHEWIEYHRLVGVDHFYLYYTGKGTPKQLLKPYIRSGIVTLILWMEKSEFADEPDGFVWPLGVQIPAYENVIYVRAAGETKWLTFLDINEYLVPPENDSVADVLKKYNDCTELILSCDCFNSSKMNAMPEIRLLIENRELIAAPNNTPHNEVAKTMFKPAACQGFIWPPYQCKMNNNGQSVKVPRSELRINRYLFHGRSYLENLKRKFYGDNRSLSEKEMSTLLKQGYEIEDQEHAIERFIPQLCKKLGIEANP